MLTWPWWGTQVFFIQDNLTKVTVFLRSNAASLLISVRVGKKWNLAVFRVYLPSHYNNIPCFLWYSNKMHVCLWCLLIPQCSAQVDKYVVHYVFSLWLGPQFTQNSELLFSCGVGMKGFIQPWWFSCFSWNEERQNSQRSSSLEIIWDFSSSLWRTGCLLWCCA